MEYGIRTANILSCDAPLEPILLGIRWFGDTLNEKAGRVETSGTVSACEADEIEGDSPCPGCHAPFGRRLQKSLFVIKKFG